MKFSVLRQIMPLSLLTASLLASTASLAADPHYTSPSENLKNFFGGTWEGSFQLGYDLPQSSAQLKNSFDWKIGVYHDFGSNMAVEFQYMSTGDFDSEANNGESASFKTDAYIMSLRGYGKTGPGDVNYFGRLGVAFYDVDFDNGSTVQKGYDSGETLVLGFGAEKKTNDKTTFTLEIMYFQDLVQSGYVNSINFGIRHALAEW